MEHICNWFCSWKLFVKDTAGKLGQSRTIFDHYEFEDKTLKVTVQLPDSDEILLSTCIWVCDSNLSISLE